MVDPLVIMSGRITAHYATTMIALALMSRE